jgi:hypothetical protein
MSSLLSLAGNAAPTGFYDFPIEQSLRFNDDDNAYLSRTPASAGNRKTWTFSCWVKRGNLNANTVGNVPTLFAAQDSSAGAYNVITLLNSVGNDVIYAQLCNGSTAYYLETSQTFRDVAGWYNIVWSVDTTQATASDRAKLYVNGEQVTSFATAQYPPQNTDTDINSTVEHQIGKFPDYTRYFDGYMAEVNLIDGQALDPTSFGELKSGIWTPVDTSGLTFGTNGFRLQYADSAAIGDDTSGNTNDWTANNLVASDVVLDGVTNNFAVMNPLSWNVMTFAEGNLKISTTTNNRSVHSTFAIPSTGKWIYEFQAYDYTSGGGAYIGFSNNINEGDNEFTGDHGVYYQTYDGGFNVEGTVSTATGYTVQSANFTSDGDIHTIAIDMDNQKLYFAKNGAWRNSADPAAGTGGLDISACFTSPETDFHACVTRGGSLNETYIFNFGQDSTFAGNTTAGGNTDENGYGDFKYAPPSGYLALCSANLPTGAINTLNDETPEDYFGTTLYNGTLSSTGTADITHGLSFTPDFVWTKSRSAVSQHILRDIIRGANNALRSEDTAAESDKSGNGNMTSLATSTTFSTNYTDGLNVSGKTFVGWSWKAGGTGVSNTDGSITSTVSVGATSQQNWFSVVSYTGTGANATVGHGLGVAPQLYIVKYRNAAGDWKVYSEDVGNTYQGFLNDTSAFVNTGASIWNNTSPTSSVFSIGTNGGVNTNGGNYIAYCFANAEGLCKVGSFVGNGSADGTFVYTGHKPSLLLIKRTDSARDWALIDTTRDIDNPTNKTLIPNVSDAEYSGITDIDILSNGFKPRTSGVMVNASGGSYIFLSIASQPFKYANAR